MSAPETYAVSGFQPSQDAKLTEPFLCHHLERHCVKHTHGDVDGLVLSVLLKNSSEFESQLVAVRSLGEDIAQSSDLFGGVWPPQGRLGWGGPPCLDGLG
jgi:hypothetical protein